ncbi:MAG: glycosyltransferase family 4 protein [Bacteroidales bacterium]|nr:glycosyltransferase family 4 protein [Bacteroidales bacterium]
MINVLYISHETYEVAGSTLSLANHLHALRHDVHPLIVMPAQGPAADHLRHLGYEVRIVHFKLNLAPDRLAWLKRPIRKVYDRWRNMQACRTLTPIIRDAGIQLIHSNTSATIFGSQLARYIEEHEHRHIPHIWHLREFLDLDFGFTPLYGWTHLRKLVNDADATISITQAVHDHFIIDSNDARHHVVNDAVRSLASVCHSTKQPYFVFCGKVIPEKGAEHALDIFQQFNLKHPGYRLVYVGRVDESYQQLLEDKAKGYGIGKAISFEHFQTDVRPFISQATALLMCSPNEAQGRVTVEAMFYGTPVIAMAAGGSLEIVDDNNNGLLFHNVAEGAQQCCRIVEDPLLAQSIIEKALQTATSRFSEEVYRKKVIQIYNSLLPNNTP